MAIIMDGKAYANQVFVNIKETINEPGDLGAQYRDKNGNMKALAIIKVGDDPASDVYLSSIIRDANKCGFRTISYRFNADYSTEDIRSTIRDCNLDDSIAGIMLQLPIPNKTPEEVEHIIDTIYFTKDIDGITYRNKSELYNGNVILTAPCTAEAITAILSYYKINLDGKHAVIVGRSNVVGKPLAMLLLQANATVTICHSHTQNLGDITRTADVLISATGCMHLIKQDMVKPGAVVVDVGIIRHTDGKLYGDVDFENVKEVASYITPVPGGIGHATRAMLFEKLCWACVRQH